MTMTSEEIVRDYNQASNKSKQIKILAELNCCSPGEIRQVLAEAGVAGVKMPERIVKRKPVPEAKASAPVPVPAFFDRVETILSALPEELSDDAASCVQNLLQTLFADYLHQRLMGRR